MKHLVSRELHAYWDALRGTRATPERSDLDPVAIRSVLPDTLILDVAQASPKMPRDAVVRLSGTRLDALWSGALKGRSLLSLWRPADRAAIGEILDLVLDDQIPVVAGAACVSPERGATELELLLLPLRHHGRTHTRLLGSIAPITSPRWLGLYPLDELTLTSFRSIAPGVRAPLRPSVPTRPNTMPAPARHGRFTVYDGGRTHKVATKLPSISPIDFRHP